MMETEHTITRERRAEKSRAGLYLTFLLADAGDRLRLDVIGWRRFVPVEHRAGESVLLVGQVAVFETSVPVYRSAPLSGEGLDDYCIAVLANVGREGLHSAWMVQGIAGVLNIAGVSHPEQVQVAERVSGGGEDGFAIRRAGQGEHASYQCG